VACLCVKRRRERNYYTAIANYTLVLSLSLVRAPAFGARNRNGKEDALTRSSRALFLPPRKLCVMLRRCFLRFPLFQLRKTREAAFLAMELFFSPELLGESEKDLREANRVPFKILNTNADSLKKLEKFLAILLMAYLFWLI
jgi:hypothetical protein